MAEVVRNFEDALLAFDKLSKKAWVNLTYRGHADTSWAIIPSLFRQKPDVAEFESEMIRELISLFPQDFLTDSTMFDRLVRMQHYGLPTRLLDVTRNPLVALFFAVWEEEYKSKDGCVMVFSAPDERCKFFDSDVVSCMSNLANLNQDEREILESTKASTITELRDLQPTGRLVQFIKAEKPYFEPRIKKIDLFRPVVVTAKRANQRMSAQSGSFILYGLDAEKSPSYKKSISPEMIVIPSGVKPEIRRRLESIGIEASLLFPEIDKATGRILDVYKAKVIPF